MHFLVPHDTGKEIYGWVVPDGFSEQAFIRVLGPDGDLLGIFPCDIHRADIQNAGRHETGNVCFLLDENKIPGLSTLPSLEIREEQTNFPIYRRVAPGECLQKKLFRLETQVHPLSTFDRACARKFQQSFLSVERYGAETAAHAIFYFRENTINKSGYVSGRLMMRLHEEAFESGFQAIVFLTDPYVEMAARLFLFQQDRKTIETVLDERERLSFASTIDYFLTVDLKDERQVGKALKRAPKKVLNTLRSPVLRQLTVRQPGDPVNRRNISGAFDLLSRFEIVGHQDNATAFQQEVADLLGIEGEIPPFPEVPPPVVALAQALRSHRLAEALLEEDLILDYYVRKALQIGKKGGHVPLAPPV